MDLDIINRNKYYEYILKNNVEERFKYINFEEV